MQYNLYHGTGDLWFRQLDSSHAPSYRHVPRRGYTRVDAVADWPYSVNSGHYSGYPDYPDFVQVLDTAGLKQDGFYVDHPDYDRDDPSTHPRWRPTAHWQAVSELDMFRVSSMSFYNDCVQHLGFQDELVQFMELLWSGLTSLAGVAGEGSLEKRKAEADKLQAGFADIYQSLDRATTERDVLIALAPYLHELEWSPSTSPRWIIRNYVRPVTDYITANGVAEGDTSAHDAHVALRTKWTKGYISHPRFLEFSEFGKVFNEGAWRHHQWSQGDLNKIAKSIDDLTVPTIPDLDEDDEE